MVRRGRCHAAIVSRELGIPAIVGTATGTSAVPVGGRRSHDRRRVLAQGRDRAPGEMAANGLVQGERGLEIYVMCEIPSNVILAK
jgi:phosphoenolpyruvate synthase/pyruvate phosphate dikinase